ncbi:hypothetical protein I4U23_016360 [Adineta vaga]|nr:hypothetical protein I4U23_016360 [Adineta vaga]
MANREKDIAIEDKRREQDRIQAEATLKQEADIDEKRRQHQLVIADNIQKDLVLSTYIHDIADRLVLNNFSLNHELLISVIRPKTLITLRQLDANRKAFLLSFFYDSHLLLRNHVELTENVNEPISLQGAFLDGLDMSVNVPSTDRRARLRFACFAGASLTNSSFVNRDLYGADFSEVYADTADFTRADIAYTRFYQVFLRQANFYFVSMSGIDFTKADLTGAKNIDEESLLRATSLVSTILPNGTIARDKRLLKNSGGESALDSDCDNGDLPSDWNIRLGKVTTARYSFNEHSNRCYFVGAGNDDISSIYQIVSLNNARYWIDQNHGEFYIGARLSPNSFVNVTQGKLRQATIAGKKYSSVLMT